MDDKLKEKKTNFGKEGHKKVALKNSYHFKPRYECISVSFSIRRKRKRDKTRRRKR